MVLIHADYMHVCTIFAVSQEELYYILHNPWEETRTCIWFEEWLKEYFKPLD